MASSQLIISGVIDGDLSGGNPKAVELYALSDIADLSAYAIGSANNGGGSDGQEFIFPSDSATAGDYITIATESTEFNNFFGYTPDYTDGAASINGDDAIELFFNNAVVDVFGEIDVDGTDQPWEYTDGWARRIVDRYPAVPPFNLQSGSLVVQMHSILVPLMASVLIHSPSNTLPTPPLKVFHSNHSP